MSVSLPGSASGEDVLPDDAAPRPSLPRIGGLVLRSAVLPGTGHLATGHRRTGWALLTAFLLLVAGAVGLVVWGATHHATAASLTVRPGWLKAVMYGAPVLAVLWIGVIVWSAVLARPGRRGASGRFVAGGLAVLLAAAVAVPAGVATRYADVQLGFLRDVFSDGTPVQAAGTTTPVESSSLPRRLDVLLIGSDAGPDRTGTRTDTMVLASLDTKTGRTVLFTLPRNLERVPFAPGSVMAAQFPRGFSCGDECLLNAVYRWAEDRPDLFPGDPEPGLTALKSAVSATLGVPVDYTAMVDLAGFPKLVDALGGVTIRVERRLPIGGLDAVGNHVKPSGYVEAGLQHMDGDTALAYARSRSDSSDYERVQRQRCLLGGLQRQANPSTLLVNFSKLANSTADALQTDIPRSLLPDLVKLAFKIKSQPVQSLTFTPPLVDVARPDFAAIRTAVAAALVPPTTSATPSPSTPPAPSAGVPSAPPVSPPALPDDTPVSVDSVCAYS